jgi:hypothetical protein
MIIIDIGRGRGKTYQLIARAAENSAYIICKDRAEAERIFQSALDRGLNINFPLTFSEFINKEYYGKGIKEFMIDDVDMLLAYLSNVPVSYCTSTLT